MRPRKMVLWFSCSSLFLLGVAFIVQELRIFSAPFGIRKEISSLKRVSHQFQEIEELFSAGIVPSTEQWMELETCPSPWGALVGECLQKLRESGGAVLPTLRRLRALAQQNRATLLDAQARSSQAIAQAGVCASLVPILGSALYYLLPGVAENLWIWSAACGFSLLMSAVGAGWLFRMAENARWGGLPAKYRNWVLITQCAGERFLAFVRAGNPPDIAWEQTVGWVSRDAPELALEWGISIWQPAAGIDSTAKYGTMGISLIQAGVALRKSIQVSLMEGRGCSERVESALENLRTEMRAQIERETTLLGTRGLKPIFICVAPSLLGLLAIGLFLGWSELL